MSVLEDLNYTRIRFMGMKSLMPCLGMSKKSYCQWALSGQPFQGDGQFFEMPVVWCKTNVYECLLFHNIYSAEHDAFYKAVHCEVLHGSAIEELMWRRQKPRHRGRGGNSWPGMSCMTYGPP